MRRLSLSHLFYNPVSLRPAAAVVAGPTPELSPAAHYYYPMLLRVASTRYTPPRPGNLAADRPSPGDVGPNRSDEIGCRLTGAGSLLADHRRNRSENMKENGGG